MAVYVILIINDSGQESLEYLKLQLIASHRHLSGRLFVDVDGAGSGALKADTRRVGLDYAPHMSQTKSSWCPSPTPVPFNRGFWDYQVHSLQEILASASLSIILYSVFTILCATSIYSLTQRSDKIRPPSIVLALTLLTLFTSTTIFMVYSILSAQSTILNSLLSSASALWGLSLYSALEFPGPGLIKDYTLPQQCAGTAALTINILLGDAIVCWRACVLWNRSRVVESICVMFLLTTLGLGIVHIKFTCDQFHNWALDPHAVGTGSMYTGVSYGIAASVLSFSTNLVATLLVGYKAWFVRKHVIAGSLGLQTERVLALLIESGALYCALWAVVVSWQIGEYQKSVEASGGIGSFWDVFQVVINAALVPLIAIYPTIIIILVALNQSQVEHGFDADDDLGLPRPSQLPLRTLTITIGSVTADPIEADGFVAQELGPTTTRRFCSISGASKSKPKDNDDVGATQLT